MVGAPAKAIQELAGHQARAARMDVVAGKKRPGTRFTQKDKAVVKQDNASRNEGKNRCENCDVETVQAQQHKKGITPPKNETQVDHME
jgi:hypothetical protein